MRDPNLIVRAQQAAAELEQAWDRWRTLHGLGIDPPPPVSSYVGYSLEEPWGQPRVVFGIDAREAEQLAALLDRHDCNGPVYASVATLATTTRTAETTEARAPESDRHQGAGRVRVPTQAQPTTAQREKPPEPAQREAPQRDNGTREDEPGPLGAGRQAQEPATADHEPSALRADQTAEAVPPGPPAFRPRLEPADYAEEDQDPDLAEAEPAPAAEPSQASAGWTRASRAPGGHALSRQKRTPRGTSAKQRSRDRSGPEAMAADLAGWTVDELPGQASRLC